MKRWILCMLLAFQASLTPEAYVEDYGSNRNFQQQQQYAYTRAVPWLPEQYPNPDLDQRSCRTFLNRFCDPDGMLAETEVRGVENFLQMDRRFEPYCLPPPTDNGGANGPPNNNLVEIQVAVALVKSMDLSRVRHSHNREMRAAEDFARYVHDSWGVGMQTPCGGTGVLLFLSELDRTVYISRGQAMEPLLTTYRIEKIVSKMRPFLKERQYARGVLVGLQEIDDYIRQGPANPSEGAGERAVAMGVLGVFGLIFAAAIYGARQDARNRRQYAEVQSHLNALDQQRAQALQGQYRATSCPICLENFQMGNGGSSSLQRGSDGLPVKLLRCGHVFDESCWLDWVRSGAGHVDRCPICREDVGQRLQRPTSTTLPNTSYNDHDSLLHRTRGATTSVTYEEPLDHTMRMYLNERNFRLRRLGTRYPHYIRPNIIDTWISPTFSGPLAADPLFMTLDPQRQQQQRNATRQRQSSGSGFGGGRSSGGGGGRW